MSVVKKNKTFSSDDRGEIIDIFSKEPKEHCTIVTFKKNAVRGNHFHKKSIQSAYVLDGKFKMAVNGTLMSTSPVLRSTKFTTWTILAP